MRSADRLGAYVSASPAEEWYWIICFRSDFAYSSGNMNWIARITYDVEFYDRAYLGLSSLASKLVREAYLARIAELTQTRKQMTSGERKELPDDRKAVSDNPKPSIPQPIMVGGPGQGGSTYAYVSPDDPEYVRIAQTPLKRGR